jgi:hypothetical protein
MLAWHVVFCAPGLERRAASDFCCLPGIDGFCPSAFARWWHRGRIYAQPLPLIARVTFGQWDGANPHLWHAVRRTIGVRGILNRPGEVWPQPVRGAAFESWRQTAGDDWVVPEASLRLAKLRRGYATGDEVVIHHRALPRGALGRVEHVDERRHQARAEYDLIGRPQRAIPVAGAAPGQRRPAHVSVTPTARASTSAVRPRPTQSRAAPTTRPSPGQACHGCHMAMLDNHPSNPSFWKRPRSPAGDEQRSDCD